MYNQAQKIIDKFGGVRQLASAMGCDASAIYKWTYERDKGGTEGLIPTSAMATVIKAAEVLGIELSPEDMDPR